MIFNDQRFIRFLYYFFKMFGLMVMKFDLNLNKKKIIMQRSIFNHSKRGVLCNLFLICLLLFSSFICVESVYYYDYLGRHRFEKISETFQSFFSFLTALIIVSKFCIQQQNAIKIFNQLYNILRSLILFNLRKNEKKDLLKTLKVIFSINIAIWLIIFTINIGHGFSFTTMFLLFFPALIINWMLIQFTMVLKLILDLFFTLNVNFQCIQSISTFMKTKDCHTDGNKDEIVYFSELRLLYLSLCEVSQDIIHFYVLPLLFSISYIFITSIFFIYYPVTALIKKYPLSFFSTYLSCWVMIALFIFLMIILTNTAGNIVAEVNPFIYYTKKFSCYIISLFTYFILLNRRIRKLQVL